jgi:hypothetical protein
MTLMSSISKLTGSVDKLTAEANVTKAQLDAKVAQAEAEIVATQAEQAATEAARNEAAAQATEAATHLATVKADVTYQGISAILAEKVVTAVDVFIYDTGLDSDGGAWRKRCQHTSWYNEPLNTATRGTRREFPAVAVIVSLFVGDFCQLRIYDGDDPTLPFWREFNNEPLWDAQISKSSTGFKVFALNGLLAVAHKLPNNAGYSGNGMALINFPPDQVSLLTKNMGGTYFGIYPAKSRPHSGIVPSIVDFSINDVAMTVLPNAPIDLATDLPVPTIAVATNGGVSVIQDDGSVRNLSFSSFSGTTSLAFLEDGRLICVRDAISNGSKYVHIVPLPLSSSHSFTDFEQYATTSAQGAQLLIKGGQPAFVSNGILAIGRNGALNLIQSKPDETARGLVAHITSNHTTGWMPGDIKGAFLADTDNMDLNEGASVLSGLFEPDRTITGQGTWRAIISVASVSGGILEILHNHESSPSGRVVSGVDVLEPGKTYRCRWTVDELVGDATGSVVQIGTDGSGNQGIGSGIYLGVGSFEAVLAVPQGSTNLRASLVASGGTPTGAVAGARFSGFTIEEAVSDRSVNNNGLIVNGTISRSSVATGAELMAYSGFNKTTNFLQQAYNPALDFGTGDFSVMVWLDRMETWRSVISRGIDISASLVIEGHGTENTMRINLGGTPTTRNLPWFSGEWKLLALLRQNGVAKLYLNGVETDSWDAPQNLTLAGAKLVVGNNDFSGSGYYPGKMALLRISATAPTPDQIAKLYEDERKLFNPGAQCTLYGTSDAVTALAHDPKTNLLHVGTNQGRSLFDGFLRVANTETPVTTAISAVGGMIAEQ